MFRRPLQSVCLDVLQKGERFCIGAMMAQEKAPVLLGPNEHQVVQNAFITGQVKVLCCEISWSAVRESRVVRAHGVLFHALAAAGSPP